MIISVYAPKPGYGASTVARMLALSLAERESVLYVELDYYFPSTPLVSIMKDQKRSLDHCLDQFNQLGEANWSFHDYVKRYHKTNLALLVPLGMKGFERFPEEHPDFIRSLIAQATAYGYKHVVFDVVSLPDTIFCREALANSNLIFSVVDHSYGGICLFYHRLDLFKELHILENMELVLNDSQRSGQYNKLIKHDLLSKKPVAMIPYVSALTRADATSEILVPLKAKREVAKLVALVDQIQEKGASA